MGRRLAQMCAHIVALARGKSAAAAVFQTFGVRILLLAVNFGTGIIVARSLGPFGRGEQVAIALWPSFLAALATFGIPTALRYHSRRNPADAPQYYAASFLIVLVVGVLAAAAGAAIMPLMLRGYDQAVLRTAQAFMVFAPQILLLCVIRAHLEAMGDFRRSILSELNPNIITLLALIVLRLSGHLSPVSASLSYALPGSIQMLVLAAQLRPRAANVFRELAVHARTLLAYGVRSYGTDVIGALASQLDLAVIVTFLSAAELGYYTIALTLSRLLNIVQGSLVPVIFPRASSMQPEEGVALITRAARFSMVASAGLGGLFLCVIPIALPRLYGSAYGPAIQLMPLLTAEAIIGGLGSVLSQSFPASGRPFVATLIEAGSIACAIGFLFLLVPRMGVLGAATALLCTSVIRVSVIMAAYRVALDRPFPRLILDGDDLAYVQRKIGSPFNTTGARLASKA